MLQVFAWPELTSPFTAGAVSSTDRDRPGDWSCSARSVSAPERGQRHRPTGPVERKSLRETVNPLKRLKTAKSSVFSPQRYQGLGQTRDFAGEAIWFRFRFVFVSRAIFCPKTGRREGLKNLQKPPIVKKGFFLRLTP